MEKVFRCLEERERRNEKKKWVVREREEISKRWNKECRS